MVTLPNELLETIFSYLTPHDLLGSVPLVCRRWRDVARSKASWRNAVVIFRRGQELAVARVARLAPALGCLYFQDDSSCFIERRKLVSNNTYEMSYVEDLRENVLLLWRSLLSGVEDVRHLRLPIPQNNKGSRNHSYLMLMNKYKEHLVKLETGIYSGKLTMNEEDVNTVDLIASMPRLEYFTIRVKPSSYNGVTPATPHVVGSEELPEELTCLYSMTADVLRNHDPQLTHLSLVDNTLHGPIAEAVIRCRNLRSVRLNVASLSLVKGMRQLESLHLVLDGDWITPDRAELTADFIRSSDVVARLKAFEMCLRRGEIATFVSGPHYAISPILRAVGDTCRDLRSLALDVDHRNEDMEWLLAPWNRWEKLEQLDIKGLSLAFLQNIERLPVLRHLRIQFNTTTRSQEMAVESIVKRAGKHVPDLSKAKERWLSVQVSSEILDTDPMWVKHKGFFCAVRSCMKQIRKHSVQKLCCYGLVTTV